MRKGMTILLAEGLNPRQMKTRSAKDGGDPLLDDLQRPGAAPLKYPPW